MLFVASAGNQGIDNDEDFPALPATFDLPNIVSIAAIDNDGGIAAFSNYGATTVDIAAPGVGDPEHAPGRQHAPATGLGLARRHLDGGPARRPASSP